MNITIWSLFTLFLHVEFFVNIEFSFCINFIEMTPCIIPFRGKVFNAEECYWLKMCGTVLPYPKVSFIPSYTYSKIIVILLRPPSNFLSDNLVFPDCCFRFLIRFLTYNRLIRISYHLQCNWYIWDVTYQLLIYSLMPIIVVYPDDSELFIKQKCVWIWTLYIACCHTWVTHFM